MSLKDIKIDTEYLDVLDENGKATGTKKTKEEIHSLGDWHGTIQVWLINSNGEILMQKRSELKTSRPGKWDNSCAGHISAGESVLCAAARELQEELGINIKTEEFEHLYTLKTKQIEHNGDFINHQFNNTFLVKIDINIDDIKLEEEEVSEVKFIHHSELEKHLRNETMDFDFYPDFYTYEINKLFEAIREGLK
jgi:isopentenyl-diphosphate delta-isomerase